MMLWELLRDKSWKKKRKGFKKPKGRVIWTDAEMSKDGRHRVRVSRQETSGYGYYDSSYEIVAYLKPHTEVELVSRPRS